ncbi:hypothetical protein BpHYR1_004696 [Brachionus plicatilis]|uniref:Uncharacterized protein n=1 Tax=Brachionus plicatilis TaxID=10195 RepID=A0A3M7SK34_BRAPC|nr:hypothetical protein BpHYR1_004696 [Brachionus plicatilis]
MLENLFCNHEISSMKKNSTDFGTENEQHHLVKLKLDKDLRDKLQMLSNDLTQDLGFPLQVYDEFSNF